MEIRDKAQEIADEVGLELKEMKRGRGFIFYGDSATVSWYMTGAIVVRKKGVKARSVGCVGVHKLKSFLLGELNRKKWIILDPIVAVSELANGKDVFYIEKSMSECNFELWESLEKVDIGSIISGKYVFRLKPVSVTINGHEFLCREEAKQEFMRIYGEME